MKRIGMIFLVALLCMSTFVHEADATAGIPEISSEAAILMDTQTGSVLYGKNEEAKMYPASLTKIATAIYAIEKGDLNDVVTIHEDVPNVEGTRVYLNQGEQVSLKKLVQGMMINSGNDAAVAIAIHLDGSLEEYAVRVNDFLHEEVGVNQTQFQNPHGLYNENHYTTAKDIGTILNYAMKNSEFREIFSTKELDWKGESWETTLYTHHRMVKGEVPYEGVTGGKTGFINESKQTLATTAENGQIQLTAILLKSETKRNIYQDTIQLFEYGFHNYKTSLIKKDSVFRNGSEEFIAKADTFLTEPIGAGKRDIDSNGILIVEDQKGREIQSVKLDPVADEEVKVTKTTQTPEESGVVSLNAVVGITIVSAVMIGWLLNRAQRRNRRKYRC